MWTSIRFTKSHLKEVLPSLSLPPDSCPKPKLEKELKRMVGLGIIEPVDELDQWTSHCRKIERKATNLS